MEAQGIAILSSCEQGQQSWEWPGKPRSVFTHFLLEALRGQADWNHTGFVTVSDANLYVTNGVKKWAVDNSRAQTPRIDQWRSFLRPFVERGNRAVFQFSRRADVFIVPRDYSYLLQFYARHVLPVVDTYAYGASGAIVSTC